MSLRRRFRCQPAWHKRLPNTWLNRQLTVSQNTEVRSPFRCLPARQTLVPCVHQYPAAFYVTLVAICFLFGKLSTNTWAFRTIGTPCIRSRNSSIVRPSSVRRLFSAVSLTGKEG